MRNKYVLRVIKLYKLIYQGLFLLTPVYFTIGILALYWQKNHGREDLWDLYLPELIIFGIFTIRYFIWFNIFKIADEILCKLKLVRPDSFYSIRNLFVMSFVFDFVIWISTQLLDLQAITNWGEVKFPILSVTSVEFFFGVIRFLFKVVTIGSGFITPSTFGLSSLFVAIVFHLIGTLRVLSQDQGEPNEI